jgi:hypothetical protein
MCYLQPQILKATPLPASSKNNGPTIRYRDTTHQTPIVTNAEDFHTAHVGFSAPYCTFLTINVSIEV